MKMKRFVAVFVAVMMILGTLAAVPTFAKDFSEGAVADEAVTASNIDLFSSTTVGDTYVAKIGETNYTTLQEALSAADVGDTVTLLSNVAISTSGTGEGLRPQILIGKSITLDLAGYTIGYSDEVKNGNPTYTPAFFEIQAGVEVTITGNGTIDCEAGNNNAYGINVNGGSLTIENGTYLGALTAVQVQQGSLIVKDGTFDMAPTCKEAVAPQYAKYVVNAIDRYWADGTATISVESGTFVGFDPANKPENSEKTYVADSSFSECIDESTNTYKVAPKQAAVGDDLYNYLQDAVAAAQDGDTVTVLRDCIIDKPIEIKKSISIVGEGETAPTIKTTTADRVFNVTETSENLSISIKNIKAIEDSNNGYTRGISFYKNTGKIEFNIDKCEISSTYYALNVASENSNVVINVDNSKINGWAVAQTWSNNTSITINNSECISLNDKTYNADGSNDFSAFVFNVGVNNSYITLNNTEVKCQIEADENGNKNNQSIVSFRENQLENKLSINGGKCSGYSFFGVSYENTGYDVNISGTTFSYNGKEYVANGCFLQEYEGVDDNGTYTYYIIVPAEAKVIDTAKTTGATVTLDNLNKNTAVDPAADATYKVVVETAPKADADAANAKIAASGDTNTSKAMFDISVVKTDSNGVETVLKNVTQQQVTLTLGETPTGTVHVYHVVGNSVTEIKPVTVSGNTVTFTATSFSTYAVTYNAAPLSNSDIAKEVSVAFDRVGDTNEYDIVLKGKDNLKLNRFMSADLTFDMEVTDGAVGYTIKPSTNINIVDNGNGRYEFNLDGLNASGATGAEVPIGKVIFEGNGTVEFSVKTAGTNIVNTAKSANNIVDDYIPDGRIVESQWVGILKLNNKINATFTAPTKDLTVNIAYNNAISDQLATYQDMSVTISGGDLTTPIVKHLGKDEYTLTDNAYTVEIADILTQNTAYTVTVEGAGYRTARYTVNMATNKTLNFWNNVLDADEVIEVGKDSSKTTKNFLAGDIVKDNNINIYDLSAVVSYFGTSNVVTAASAYARYDLNRDGKIDSKDVAYVLVSWNN